MEHPRSFPQRSIDALTADQDAEEPVPNLNPREVFHTWYDIFCLCSRSALSTRGSSSSSRIEWSRVTQPSGAGSRANLLEGHTVYISNQQQNPEQKRGACVRGWQKEQGKKEAHGPLTDVKCFDGKPQRKKKSRRAFAWRLGRGDLDRAAPARLDRGRV